MEKLQFFTGESIPNIDNTFMDYYDLSILYFQFLYLVFIVVVAFKLKLKFMKLIAKSRRRQETIQGLKLPATTNLNPIVCLFHRAGNMTIPPSLSVQRNAVQ